MGYYDIDIVVAKNHIIIDQWQPKNKIQVLSEFDSALEEKWLGIISEPLSFSFYTA
jgi:hypothetical protein